MKIEIDLDVPRDVSRALEILHSVVGLCAQAPQPAPAPAPYAPPQPTPAAPQPTPAAPQPAYQPPQAGQPQAPYVPPAAQPQYTPQPQANQITLDDLKRQISTWTTQPGNSPTMLQPVFQKAGAPNVSTASPDQLAMISQALGMTAEQRNAWLQS